MTRQILTEGVYYILLALVEPRHGYGIILHVQDLTEGRIRLAPGTLYGALTNLMEKSWIAIYQEDPISKRKDYVITDLGKQVLRAELSRLEKLVANGHQVLGGEGYD